MKQPSQLTHLSASAMKTFESCPAWWAGAYLEGKSIPPGRAARIGTTVHRYIQRFLMGEDIPVELIAVDVPEAERPLLQHYLNGYRDAVDWGRVLATEYQFTLNLVEGLPPLVGYIDALIEGEDGSLIIVDHKTDRTIEPLKKWQHDLQPLIYSAVCRILFPCYTSIKFRVGYVNLKVNIEWETDPSEDERLFERLRNNWEKVLQFWNEEAFPTQASNKCVYCPCKAFCEAYSTTAISEEDGALFASESPYTKVRSHHPQTHAGAASEEPGAIGEAENN